MPKTYSEGWITVPGKGRRWRTSAGEYMMQRPAATPFFSNALRSVYQGAAEALGGLQRTREAALKTADRMAGGLLPLGEPISPAVLNRMPLEVNLGYRYMSGMGNRDLELSDEFKRGAVELGMRTGSITQLVSGTKNKDGREKVVGLRASNKTPGPIKAGEVRAINSYRDMGPQLPGYAFGRAYGGQGEAFDLEPEAQPYRFTLGRYSVEGRNKDYRVFDRYDLVNEYEDKDLTTPGRKPFKAAKTALIGALTLDPADVVRAYAYLRDKPLRSFPVEFTVPRSEVNEPRPRVDEWPRTRALREMWEKGEAPQTPLMWPWSEE